MSENRVTKQSNDGKIVESLGKFYKSNVFLSLLGVDYRIPALQKVFSDHIAITAKAEQAHLDLNAAVAAQAASEVAIRPIRRALANTVRAQFGESNAKVAQFGFKPKKVAEKSAAVKADAAEKANATKASGGKKAKKKENASASTEGATVAPTSATGTVAKGETGS